MVVKTTETIGLKSAGSLLRADHEKVVRPTIVCAVAIARAVIGVQSVELSKLYIKNNGVQMAKLYGVTSPIVTAGK